MDSSPARRPDSCCAEALIRSSVQGFFFFQPTRAVENWCTADSSGCTNLTAMEVDPEILRAFGGQVDNAAALIREADVGTTVATAADGLDGSTTQWAARLVGAHVTEIAGRIATEVSDMGTAVRGAGNSYEVTDHELADSFDGIF